MSLLLQVDPGEAWLPPSVAPRLRRTSGAAPRGVNAGRYSHWVRTCKRTMMMRREGLWRLAELSTDRPSAVTFCPPRLQL